MRFRIFLPLILSLCLASLTDALAGNLDERDQTAAMTNLLTRSDLPRFLQEVSSNRWVTPYICSKWYVDRSEESKTKDLFRFNRTFGSLLTKELDECAEHIIRATTQKQNAELSSMLLDLADWLASRQGYGNLLLASRCQDIATIGLGRLVVDLKYPIESASSLLSRLDAPWHSPVVRARVLNAEAGAPLFETSNLPLDEAERMLQERWRNGQLLRIKHVNPDTKAVFEGGRVKGYEVLSGMAQSGRLATVDSVVTKSNLAFFADDSVSGMPHPITLMNTWDAKRHEIFVNGFGLQNTHKLKALLAFRSTVGKFPDNRDGFEQAWTPHAGKDNYKAYAPAWRAYSEITTGQFVDEDTRERRLTAQMTPAVVPNAQ